MSILKSIPISSNIIEISKPSFGKTRYQALYLTTSLTTLLLLQACSAGSNAPLDGDGSGTPSDGDGSGTPSDGDGSGTPSDGDGSGTPSDGDGSGTPSDGDGSGTPSDGDGSGTPSDGDGSGTPSDGDGSGTPSDGDGSGTPSDGDGNGDGGGDDSPAEVQPPSASDIVKILTGALEEDADGADYGEIVYYARANGNYTSNAGDDVLVMWQEGNVGDESSLGRGNDVVRTFIGNRSVHGNDGDDVIFSGFNDDKIYGDGGDDLLFVVGTGDIQTEDEVHSQTDAYGGEGDDVLFAGRGVSRLYGGRGNDVLHYDFSLFSEAHFWGGEGDDLFIIQATQIDDFSIYIYDYGQGNDQIVLSENLQLLDSREVSRDEEAGTRTVHVVYGETLFGEDYERVIFVYEQLLSETPADLPNLVFYDPLNRFLDGKFISEDDASYSYVIGTEFDDVFKLGDGNDYAHGLEGVDTIYGGAGNDYIYAGDGGDIVQAGAGNDFILGEAGADRLFGDEGNDHIYGDDDNDFIAGDDGNDHLYGGLGNDVLVGGKGNDYLEGGAGVDRLTGGEGADIFSFNAFDADLANPNNFDAITDFELGVDRISLDFGYGVDRSNLGRVVDTTPDSDIILYFIDPAANARTNIAHLHGVTLFDIDKWEGESGLDFFEEIILTAELV